MALNRRAVSKPSGKLRKTPTQLEFSKNIGLTYHGTGTLKPSTQRALKKLISSAVDTLVSRSPSPANDPAKMTPAIFGPICSESFAHYDRALSSWKMSQDTFPWGVDECSLIFPRAGTMRSGVCYRQPEWEPRISASDCSSWPTPRAEDGQCAGGHRGKPDSLHAAVKLWPTPNVPGGGNPPALLKKQGNHFVRRSGKKAHLSLDQAVKLWPTPKASASGPDYARRQRPGSGGDDLATKVGGQLNPTWVEWLMGFPIGWTALLASATPSSRRSRRKSGG